MNKKIQISKIPNSTLSLYKLSLRNGKVKNTTTFDSKAYSKFKYGHSEIAKAYGFKLAQKFIKTHAKVMKDKNTETPFIIASTPHKHIEQGANAIAHAFQDYLNHHLYTIGKKPISLIPIFKSFVFEGDYGTFNEEDRKRLLGEAKFFTMDKALEGKEVIVIDDIRITGTVEQKVESFLTTLRPKQIHFLYVATMNASEASKTPEIESVLNHEWVKSLKEIAMIANEGYFILNTRASKFIMSKPKEELEDFVRTMNTEFLYNLYTNMIGIGAGFMEKYRVGFSVLEQELKSRNILKKGKLQG